jgi:hypothetical protein
MTDNTMKKSVSIACPTRVLNEKRINLRNIKKRRKELGRELGVMLSKAETLQRWVLRECGCNLELLALILP